MYFPSHEIQTFALKIFQHSIDSDRSLSLSLRIFASSSDNNNKRPHESNAVDREFVYIENSSLGAKLAKFDRQLSPNLAHLGATWAILAPT